jgi:phosphohistidine phosphatase
MTVRFLLVRHARAEKHAASDEARRLTPEGRERFLALLRALQREGSLAVERIATSPYVRTRQTADLLAGVTGASVEEEPALASGASTGGEVLALARRLAGAGRGVALCGHNPEIAEAIGIAAGGSPEVKPGSVALIEEGPAGARLVWLRLPPKS